MNHQVQIPLPKEKVADFCRKWQVQNFSLFGSVLREDFRPDSDIDVMVTFAPEAKRSLFDLLAMENELKTILGRNVDLVDRRVIEGSDNWIRRKHILHSAEVVYGS